MTSEQQRSALPKDPVTWWRECHQRDNDAFERAHGRQPRSMLELSRWLAPMTNRPTRSSDLNSN
jgi:hypothetical protein